MSADDAIVKLMIDKFIGCQMLTHYELLRDKNGVREMQEREQPICISSNSMCMYYCELGIPDKSVIYNSMVSDYHRTVISRWRLSNHRLNIETGRYTKPKTKREDRLCTLCSVLEDERHVIFTCPRYHQIRQEYNHLVNNRDVAQFLNPTFEMIKDTASFIKGIESRRVELKLNT